MNHRGAVKVHGIDDPTLVAEIEQTILDSFHELALPSTSCVTVRPARVNGGWNLTVDALDRRHTVSISVPPSFLSTLIPRRLRESIGPYAGGHTANGAPQGRDVGRAFAIARAVVEMAELDSSR
jgi:hypothetical protein